MQTNDKTKAIITKTAELLSSADGGTAITTRKIADNAGINPAMVNYYFGSKDELLKAAISEMNGGRPKDWHFDRDGSRKAMFDLLVRSCEEMIQYVGLGLSKDAAAFSKEVTEISSRLYDMKRSHDNKADGKDAVSVLKTVCFLLTLSMDPEGFAAYSGTDVRVKNQLRALVSEQLDIILGDAL